MSKITIPPAALAAGARAITMALILAVEDDCRALALTDDERAKLARAAFLAMIEEWPGMDVERFMPDSGPYTIHLPLPKDRDDE